MEEQKPQSASALYVPLPLFYLKDASNYQRSSAPPGASESAAFGRNESHTLTDKVSFTLTAFEGEGKCCGVMQSAAK